MTVITRLDTVSQTFLLWLDKNNDLQPNPEDFLTDPASVVDSQQVDDQELNRVVAVLDARGLITGIPIDEDSLLARVHLTPAGILAVNEHGGDLPAWRTATGPGSMTVNAGGHVQATMNSSHVTQIQDTVATGTGEVDVAKYRRAARTILEEADELELPAEQRDALREAGEQLREEMDAPSPDHARARALAARVLQILGALTISGAGSYIVELLSSGAL